jgi:murein DD-endopeptidase MepM/ murein hydrolase activator NlpD
MEKGVSVLAAAPGVILRLRDGMRDVNVREIGFDAIKGRDAGNSVIIDHGDGWETQYGHLRQGSVLVKPGDKVEAGQPIGQIGLSGNTEFPHVHFEVRHQGQAVDPYTGLGVGSGCGQAGTPLWTEAALERLAYRPTGLLNSGFAAVPAEAEAARRGLYDSEVLSVKSLALVYWVEFFGLQAGDEFKLRLLGPDGAVVAESTESAPKPKVVFFKYTGRKVRGAAWAPGRYRGEFTLTRKVDDKIETVISDSREVELR